MHKKIAIPILVFLLLRLGTAAQEPLNTLGVDRESYGLYEAGRWKELARYGRKAIKSGFDFYYLR